jgi:hypothetical protein
MAQQTAVEWLEQHIKELETKLFNFEVSPLESPTIREGLYKQAKQMEKEQIKDAWYNGGTNGMGLFETNTGEEYYNKNYKIKDR